MKKDVFKLIPPPAPSKGGHSQFSTLHFQLLFLFSLLVFHSSLIAQQHKLDSLRHLLQADKDDTTKVCHYINYLCQLELVSDYKKADSITKISLALADKIGYRRGYTTTEFYKAVFSDEEGNYADAFLNYQIALKGYTDLNDKVSVAKTLGNMGIVYWEQGDYPGALGYYLKALEINYDTKDVQGAARNEANIGLLYSSEKQYKDALKYYLKALKTDEEIGNKQYIANITGNIGIAYQKLGDNEKALNYFIKANDLYKELGNKSGIAMMLGSIGDTYAKMGQYDKGLDYYSRSLALSKEIGEKREIANKTGNIGEAYLMKNDFADAEKYLTSSLALADSIHYLDMSRECNSSLSILYTKTGDWKKAFTYLKQSTDIADSLSNADKSQQIGKLEAKADYDKQLALKQVEDENKTALADADSKRQKVIIGSVGAIALALAVIAIIIFRSLRITRRQKVLIEQQKAEVEKQKMLVEEQKNEIVDSITYAKRLQDAILPPLSLIKQFLPESFVLYKPKDIVAGDFYWMEVAHPQPFPVGRENEKQKVLPTGEDLGGATILIAAADCTGHGVPGALVSVVCSNALNRTVKEFHITTPGKILDKVCELVLETFEKSESNVQDGMDISLASLTPSEGGIQLSWSGAYNSLLYVENGEIKEVQADKQPIGKTDNPKPFKTHTILLNPPSEGREAAMLYLFTDGYADQFGGPKGKKFKYKQLQEKLLVISSQSMEEQKKMLDETLEEWKGNLEQVDDVLIIGIRI
jgi:tetratricopeptide (TPR) repeat protein